MATLNRRGFLATTTAAATAATLAHAADCKTVLQTPAPRDYWFLHEKDDGDGFEPDEVSGSPFDPHLKAGEVWRAKRRRFEPMRKPARFRLFVGNWIDEYADVPASFYEWTDIDRGTWYDAHPTQPSIPDPTSYVELFPGLGQADSRTNVSYPLLTREEGFEAVAEHNRYELHEAVYHGGDPDSVTGIEWAALLEYAEPVEACGWSDVKLAQSGVGRDERQVHYPVRLVIPTAEELARYVIAKGGVN